MGALSHAECLFNRPSRVQQSAILPGKGVKSCPGVELVALGLNTSPSDTPGQTFQCFMPRVPDKPTFESLPTSAGDGSLGHIRLDSPIDASFEEEASEPLRRSQEDSDSGEVLPTWHAVPLEEATEEDPVVQISDPFENGGFAQEGGQDIEGGPEYNPERGFRIHMDAGAEAAHPSTALVRRDGPLAPRPGGAAPPRPPAGFSRLEGRDAFQDRLTMLKRYRRWILGMTLAGLMLAGIYAMLAANEYSASSLLLITPRSANPAVAERFDEDASSERARVMNQALILQQNPTIAQRTAARLLGRPSSSELGVIEAVAKTGEVTAERLGMHLQKEVVSVTQAREESDGLQVAATASTAGEAALVATLYTEEYVRLTRDASRETAGTARDYLADQVASREASLAAVEEELAAYLEAQNAAGLDAQTQSAVTQIASLQASLDQARVDVRTYQAQLSQLEQDRQVLSSRLASAASSTSQAEVEELDAQIAELEGLISQIYQRNPEWRGNSSAHPDLQQLTNRLQRLRAEKRRFAQQRAQEVIASSGLDLSGASGSGQAYVAELERQIQQQRSSLEGARARVAQLQNRLDAASGNLRDIPEQQRRVADLERRRAFLEQSLATLQERLSEAEVAEGADLGLVRVVKPVQTPEEPTGPGALLSLLLGGLLGGLLGLGMAALRHRTDSHVHAPSDLGAQGFTVLGTLPDLGVSGVDGRITVDGTSVRSSAVAITEPFGPRAEVFRHLYATLSRREGAAPQVLLLTAPESGAGTSFVAANLAATAAQAGRRTLLVDADTRNPSVSDLLGLGSTPALGEGPPEANVSYWSTVVPGLIALTPKKSAMRPEQRWAPDDIARMISGLRSAFDLILIDAPAALSFADASLIAPHADAAILVTEAGRSDVDAARQVADELAGVGLTQIAAVLNRFDPDSAVGYKHTAGVRHATRR